MSREKLTKRAIKAMVAPTASGRQELIWDTELAGFGIRLSGVSKDKSFVIQAKVKGQRGKRRDTIGPYGKFTVEQARAEATERLRAMRLGEDPRAKLLEQRTLRTALEDYVAARKSLKASTAEGYRAVIDRHLADWREKPLRDISREMVTRRHLAIGTAVGGSSANQVFRVLRAIYGFAADVDAGLPVNPVTTLKRRWFKIERRERMVTSDQLPAFHRAASALENQVVRDYVLLLLYTGLRRREAAALSWQEVDFTGRTLTIPSRRTKNNVALRLPMTDLVLDLLVARRAIGQTGWVFPANSKTGHVEEPKDAFDEIFVSTKIRVSPHDLRRTFATVADGAGISTLTLKALLNHVIARSDVTGGYVIKPVEELREPAQRVADKLRAVCGLLPAEGDNVAPLRG